MAAELKCPQCGADNSVPPTGLSMTCEYCGFSRPVPDAKARQKRMEQEERTRRNAEQEALKRDQKAKQQKQAAKAAGIGRLIALFGTLLPIIIVGIVLYSNGVFDKMFGPHGGGYGGPAGGRHGILDGPTGEIHYRALATQLKGENYDLVGTMEINAAEPEARVQLNLAKGNCYALAAGSPSRIVAIIVQTIPKVVQRPRSHRAMLRVCPEDTGSFAARIVLDRPGNVSWGLFWRPFSATKAQHRITPKQHQTRRKASPRKNRRRTSRRYDEPPPPPRGAPQHEPPPDSPPPATTRKPKDNLPSEDKYKINE
ncbi:MAG: hypothetical protein KC503_11825 [Myxococcales bacterium]|nr:hypothetical protein [Myxococcales bacterium]